MRILIMPSIARRGNHERIGSVHQHSVRRRHGSDREDVPVAGSP